MAGDEEAGGAELVGREGARGTFAGRGSECQDGTWVRFAFFVGMARVGSVWRALAPFGTCGIGEGLIVRGGPGGGGPPTGC